MPTASTFASFGKEFQGGGHGLEVHEENGEEFLYVTGYQAIKKFAKLTLEWRNDLGTARADGIGHLRQGRGYQANGRWGRDRFMPTNIAFRPDSTGFYVADGYGAWVVHMYDRGCELQIDVRQAGARQGRRTIRYAARHLDRSARGREPAVVVADRANGRLQWFTLDGKHQETLDGFMLPANVDTFGELMLVPELQARVTLLDGKNKVVARFGDDAAWGTEVMKREIRKDPSNGRTANSSTRTTPASTLKAISSSANGWRQGGSRSCGR